MKQSRTRVLVAVTVASCGLLGAGCAKKSSSTTEESQPSAASSSGAGKKGASPPTEADVKKLLESYFKVESCLDRLAFITHPEENKKVLKDHYGSKGECKPNILKIDTADCKIFEDHYCYPSVTIGDAGKKGDVYTYCVKETVDGPRIDWRCSVTYNPQPLKTFKAQHHDAAPTRFRLYAKVDDYFNYEYSSASKTHYSFSLVDKDNQEVWGYLERKSEEGKKLFEALKDAKRHPVMLEIGYSKRSEGTSIVEIRRVIAIEHGHRERPEEYGEPVAAPTPSAAATE